jgi:hypothetical protein
MVQWRAFLNTGYVNVRKYVCSKTPADSRFISTMHVKMLRGRGSEREADISRSPSAEGTAEFFK